MKKIICTFLFLTMALSLLYTPVALAAPAALSKSDFILRVGKTDIDLLTASMQEICAASGKKLTYKKDNTRNRLDYRVSAKEATFLTIGKDVSFPCGVDLAKNTKTARGIKVGSTEKQLLAAYRPKEAVNAGSATYYYFRAPGATETLSASAIANLATARPDYFFMLIVVVGNKTKKVISISFTSWYEAADILEQLPAKPPQASPITKADFAVKIGNGMVNLIDQGIAETSKLSGKKAVVTKEREGDDYFTYYMLKTNEATLHTWDTESFFCDTVVLTSKGATARGIKLGSTEKELLAAYPKPISTDKDDKYLYYNFGVPIPASGLTQQDSENLDKIRPLYFYSLCFTVSVKTHKVTEIVIMQLWAG